MSTFPQFNKPGPELFYDLVNKTNGTSFRLGDLVLENPQPGTHPEHSFVNTIIVVKGTDRVAFKGPEPLHYRRVDLNLLLGQQNVAFDLPEGTTDFTTDDLIPLINARFEIMLGAEDIVGNNWTIDPDNDLQVTIEATVTCLTYVGQLELTIKKPAGEVVDPLLTIEAQRYVDAGQSFALTVRSIDGPVRVDTVVNLDYSEARPDVDYTYPGPTLTIPAGAESASVTVQTLDNGVSDGDKTLVVRLMSGSGYEAGSPDMAYITIVEPWVVLPTERHFFFNANTPANDEEVKTTIEVTKPSFEQFLLMAKTAQLFSPVQELGVGFEPMEPELRPVSHTENFGVIHWDELDLQRKYAPIGDLVNDRGDFAYIVPDQAHDNYNPTGINLRIRLEADTANAWQAELIYEPKAKWGRFISSAGRDTFAPFPPGQNADDPEPSPLPMGTTTLDYSGKLLPIATSYGIRLALTRLDNRSLVTAGIDIHNGFFVQMYNADYSFYKGFEAADIVDNKAEFEQNSRSGGIELSPDGKRLTMWYIPSTADEVCSVEMGIDQSNYTRPIKLTLVSNSHPASVRDVNDSTRNYPLTGPGQVIEYVQSDMRAMLVMPSAGVGVRMETVFDVELKVPNQADNDITSNLTVEFENAQFTDGTDFANASTFQQVRIVQPMGSKMFDIPQFEAGVNNQILAGAGTAPGWWGGIYLLDNKLNVYIDTVDTYATSPTQGDETSPDVPVISQWFAFDSARVTSADSTPVPADLPTIFGQGSGNIDAGHAFGPSFPKFAVSLPTGILVESTPDDAVAQGPSWIYIDRRAPTVVGHGLVRIRENKVAQMVSAAVDDVIMLYCAQLNSFGTPDATVGQYWARGIDLLGNAMPNDFHIQTVDSGEPAFALWHRTQHNGKFCYHDRAGGGLGSFFWYDLPVATGQVRLWPVEIRNNTGSRLGTVVAHTDGRIWFANINDDFNNGATGTWHLLSNADLVLKGSATLDLSTFVPLSVMQNGSGGYRLGGWIGGTFTPSAEAAGVTGYQGDNGNYRISIGPYGHAGQPMRPGIDFEPLTSWMHSVNTRDRSKWGMRGQFVAVNWQSNGRRALRYGGPTFYNPGVEDDQGT